MIGIDSGLFSRREVLRGSVISSGLWITGFEKIHWTNLFSTQNVDPFREGTQLGTIDFSDEGTPPMDQASGIELDGRLFTDLSKITSANSITPTETFYVRTRASKLLDTTSPWSVQLGSLAEKPVSIQFQELDRMARPMGLHLMECAGNSRSAHFGMLSVADWHGIPMLEILEQAQLNQMGRVVVVGFDRYSTESGSSIPGASWIFTLSELNSSGAFLATRMNGQLLSLDHGAPVRLVVPGWYGCTCIKWVQRISLVAEDGAATPQMREYASRTMQTGIPLLARDFKPAVIDPAAMPVRVERWLVGGKIRLRVAGLQWGGSLAADGLEIQFNPNEPYLPVTNTQIGSKGCWNFWSQVWTPQKPGKYIIRLRLKARDAVTRRLDSGYYARSVEILEI